MSTDLEEGRERATWVCLPGRARSLCNGSEVALQVAVLEQQATGVTGAGPAEGARRKEPGRPGRALWVSL